LKNSEPQPALLVGSNIGKSFVSSGNGGVFRRRTLRALCGVDIEIRPGEKIGLIGRSGSGKSTLIRCLAKLIEPDEGHIVFMGQEVTRMSARKFRPMRRYIQVIFQNNYSALNPGMTVREMLIEAAALAGRDNRETKLIESQMEKIGLAEALLDRYPKELSGGECRRIGVALVDLIGPELLLADEPVTALDYINKHEMLALFKGLNSENGTALLFATHDLEAMIDFVDRVIVLYGGFLVEQLPIERIWEARHPHTVELVRYHGFLKNRFTDDVLMSYNSEEKERTIDFAGAGCIFAHQCQRFRVLGYPSQCVDKQPSLQKLDGGHSVACHFAEKVVE
jgi:peptide/nickel transport system ATP-binding protein